MRELIERLEKSADTIDVIQKLLAAIREMSEVLEFYAKLHDHCTPDACFKEYAKPARDVLAKLGLGGEK